MFTNIGKLLTYNIGNYDLYNFAKRFIAKVTEITGDNSTIMFYVAAVISAVEEMKKVFSKNPRNPLTIKIQRKDRERVNLLIALRRKIGIAQLMVANPEQVEAANNLKKEMKERGWWRYKKLSYGEATAIITSLLDTMAQGLFLQWVSIASLQSTLDSLKQTQAEFEALENERIDEGNSNSTLQMKIARKKLIDVLLAMLTAIDFGVETDPQNYAEIGEFAIDMIVEFNAKTRMQKTLAENGDEEAVEKELAKEDSSIETGTETEAEDEALEGGTAYA